MFFQEFWQQKKPHSYKKITVWPKDDQIRKSPLKFYGSSRRRLRWGGKLQVWCEFTRRNEVMESNSQILCEQSKKGAEAKGHQVKIVRIMEHNIGFCRSCDGCMRNGGT